MHVKFAHARDDHAVGAVADVPRAQALQLVHDGVARLVDETQPRPPAKQVLADVDGDPARAQIALDAETTGDNPRTSLVKALRRIVESNAGSTGSQENPA